MIKIPPKTAIYSVKSIYTELLNFLELNKGVRKQKGLMTVDEHVKSPQPFSKVLQLKKRTGVINIVSEF